MKQLIKFTVNNADYKIAVPSAATTSIYSSMSPKDMTAVFLDAINKQRNNIKRFIKRKPVLETVCKLKTTEGESIKDCLTIEQMIDVFTSARKTVWCKLVIDESSYDQMLGINFDTGMVVLYKKEWDNTFEMIGSIPYDTIYSNWADLFFPEYTLGDPSKLKEEEEDDEEDGIGFIEDENDESESLHPSTSKMKELLDSRAFAIWNFVYNEMKLKGRFHLRYSGSGDSGGTDEIVFSDESVTFGQREHVDQLCWDLIDTKEGGFYNNDGGYGEIKMTEKTFSWTHHNYVTEIVETVNDEVDLSEPSSTTSSIEHSTLPTSKPIDPVAGTALHSTLEEMLKSYIDGKAEWVPRESSSTDEYKDLPF